jgi:hypothetical protein
VAFAASEFLPPAVESVGVQWLRAGVAHDDPELAALEAQRSQLHGSEFVRFSIEQIFAGIRPRRLVPDLLAICESWRPDVFLHDSREFGALIAAELLRSRTPRSRCTPLANNRTRCRSWPALRGPASDVRPARAPDTGMGGALSRAHAIPSRADDGGEPLPVHGPSFPHLAYRRSRPGLARLA